MMKILLLGHGVANDGCMLLLNKYRINYDYLNISEIDTYNYDYIVKSPGILLTDPIFSKLKGFIISDIALGYMLLKPKIIGVTGTNGKTSISTMLYEVLKTKYNVCLCGNIGYSFCKALLDFEDYDYFIVEVSSFQLETALPLDFYISIISNINITHLDHHQTLDNYINAKSNIFLHQSLNNYLIYNYDDVLVRRIKNRALSKKISYSTKSHLPDIYILGKYIYYFNKKIYKITDEYQFKISNIMAVFGALVIMKFNLAKAHKILKKFKDVKYRLTKINDYIYNDAKSTNFASTDMAINSLNGKIRLICGGYDRGMNIVLSNTALDKIVKVYAYGDSKDRIVKFMSEKNIMVSSYCNLTLAYSDAIKEKEEQDIILYSPMFASIDQYKSYVERGIEFDNLVKKSQQN